MLLFSLYLVLVIGLPVVLSVVIGFRALPCGRKCPNCAQETLPVLSHGVRLLRRVYPSFPLQRRWCAVCAWDGYARLDSTGNALPIKTVPANARSTQQVRTLELGGKYWRVLLESWRERGRCYGRLLFVAPSGRLWCDPLAAFSGSTQQDVIGQARALSDRLLTYRLREVISG